MFRTRRQKSTNCRDCPVARTADLAGDTWSLIILRDLMSGAKRYSELEASLSGVSSRTLARKLKFLEERGVIARDQFKEVPPHVEYRLTRKGQEFNGVIEAMRMYGEKYLTR